MKHIIKSPTCGCSIDPINILQTQYKEAMPDINIHNAPSTA